MRETNSQFGPLQYTDYLFCDAEMKVTPLSLAGSQTEGERMVKNVYIYLILFATLMMTIGGSVAAFSALSDIIAPSPTYPSSFQEYLRMSPSRGLDEDLNEEELRTHYERIATQKRQRQIERANSLVKSHGWIFVPLPVFLYFRRSLNHHEE